MFGKKKKEEKVKSFEDGYISFTLDQLSAEAANDTANSEAYEWLSKAMQTSTSDKKKKSSDDGVYPETAEQTEQMRAYLNKAEQCAANPTAPLFAQHLSELRSIVEWSSVRHSTYSKGLIIGVLIILAGVFILKSDAASDLEQAKANRVLVDNWKEVADSTFVYETMDKPDYVHKYDNAIKYKHYALHTLKHNAENAKGSAERYTQMADTVSDSKMRKEYLKRAKENEKRYEDKFELFEELNEMKYKKVQKHAKEYAKAQYKNARASNRFAFFFTAFFVLLIPVYIFSQRPYGYSVTRLRFESKTVGRIQKFFFALAGGMASLSAIIPDAPVTVTKWSDGSTTREQNGALSAALSAIKIMLLGGALLIFCGVSFILMVYLTVQGLRRNYNWDNVRAQAKAKAQDLTNKQ